MFGLATGSVKRQFMKGEQEKVSQLSVNCQNISSNIQISIYNKK